MNVRYWLSAVFGLAATLLDYASTRNYAESAGLGLLIFGVMFLFVCAMQFIFNQLEEM